MEGSVKPFGIFKIAAAYIGTVVGAGFASGQEVLRFFAAYGISGIWGILVSSALFFFIGYTSLLLGRKLHAASHMPVVRHTNGYLLGTAIDMIVTLFLFGGLCTMLAGAGAVFTEQFSLPAIAGVLFMMAVTLITVLTGTRGVVTAISYVVPFLIVALLYIFVRNLLLNPVTEGEIAAAAKLPGSTPHWLLSAVNYASYNIVISVGVLAPMGAVTPDKRKLLGGALLGSGGLMFGMLTIFFCLLTNITEVGTLEVPMASIAQQISAVMRIAFALVLLAEIYSTAVGNLFAFTQRLNVATPSTRAPARAPGINAPRWLVIAITTALALLVAQLGFSNMVRFLYPAVGYGGMLFFGGVAYTWIRKRDSLR